MQPFDYTALPGRVIFGSGTLARVPELLAELGGKHALVLSTPQQADVGERALALLGAAGAGLFSGATMHTPVEVTEQALAYARSIGADSVVSVGGGSTTGLGKALALRTDMPQVVVPTRANRLAPTWAAEKSWCAVTSMLQSLSPPLRIRVSSPIAVSSSISAE